MTTARSPLHRLQQQADHIAQILKAVERGENPVQDVGGKIAAARERPNVKFGVAMDDKFLSIDMTWSSIRDTTESGIAEYILQQMREAGGPVN